jgi:hypothetical protein
MYVQGGALNRGLFFAGLPPSPLGAVSGKISEFSDLSNSINIAAGTGGAAIAVEMACRRHTAQSSARTGKIFRFSKASARQRHGFQCEKAFKRWSGPDATAERRKEPMRAE